MISVFAEVGGNLQQVGGECPPGWIEMERQRQDGDDTLLYTAQPDGTWAITQETLNQLGAERESVWAVDEMKAIADQLLMLEDGDPKALSGTEREWRDYRIALRDWKEGAAGFPEIEQRPARPS